MTLRYYGTVLLVTSAWWPDDSSTDEIMYRFEDVKSHIDVAVELWRLVDVARADEIVRVLNEAYVNDPCLLPCPRVRHLHSLLDGLEDRLIGVWMDAKWETTAERLEELRRRTTMLEFDVEGVVQLQLLAAGVSRVIAAKNVLSIAINENLDLVFDT
jgi:hypothetical protein